eukprot:Skav213765  [mRNA]  locus=scaffold3859:366332:369945:- [translate_table: standard]
MWASGWHSWGRTRQSISIPELQFRLEVATAGPPPRELLKSLGQVGGLEPSGALARYGSGALLQTFGDADVEGSGRLSFSQLEGARAGAEEQWWNPNGVLLRDLKLPLSREKLQELFDIFNTDHSGTISYYELLNRLFAKG